MIFKVISTSVTIIFVTASCSGILWTENSILNSVFQSSCSFPPLPPHLSRKKVFLKKNLKLVFTINSLPVLLQCWQIHYLGNFHIYIFTRNMNPDSILSLFTLNISFWCPLSFSRKFLNRWVSKISNFLSWLISQYVYLEEEWRHIYIRMLMMDIYFWKWKNSLFETKVSSDNKYKLWTIFKNSTIWRHWRSIKSRQKPGRKRVIHYKNKNNASGKIFICVAFHGKAAWTQRKR